VTRGTWVFDRASGELVPKDEFYARQPARKRSHLACPHIATDTIELQSMVDGKVYTSKAALRQSYKARGYVEVGNEEPVLGSRVKPDRKAVRDSIGKAFNRVGLPTT
jgi:hypothetical protein